MKYNTISTSSLSSEGKKSTLTIYADMDVSHNKVLVRETGALNFLFVDIRVAMTTEAWLSAPRSHRLRCYVYMYWTFQEHAICAVCKSNNALELYKMAYTEKEMALIRGELEIVQKALKLQTKRCRQLVVEYTRRLQEKELQFNTEKALREDQLAKVLKALLLFEARLKQEQKYITHQLNEKDFIIKKQNSDIKKLLINQFCKNCNQYYSPSPILESLDSSSEYVATDYQDYQSSNFESLDSSSETYATISEKCYDAHKIDNLESVGSEDISKTESDSTKNMFQKNRNKDSLGRKTRKVQHRKSVGTYFEVLKLRNDNPSPCSNEDNTSNDYDNFDSLPPESITDKISLVSESNENTCNKNSDSSYGSTDALNDTESSLNISVSECNNTVINKNAVHFQENVPSSNTSTDSQNNIEIKNNILNESLEQSNNDNKISKISDSIPVFEGDGETNDNWYASASDPEDEEHRDIYRNNPVLECMNQILLQNMADSLNSPPKTPNIGRKSLKNKRVKFSDEEDNKQENALTKENLKEKQNSNHDYYETPIQKPPNYYETPQSIYSNDYEQILSKCSETFTSPSPVKLETNKDVPFPGNEKSHLYLDMDTRQENTEQDNKIVRKTKISRIPPALPPKPANLVSKYKIQSVPTNLPKSNETNLDSEPDYCSISELNLPQQKNLSFKKINVVAEINAPTSHDVRNKLEKLHIEPNSDNSSDYDSVIVNDNISNLVVKKCVEKLNIQMAKQTPIKSETSTIAVKLQSPKKNEPEIPKLPQVSEIIIPDENEEKNEEERITQDNYVKNNSQILRTKTNHNEQSRRPIIIGSSVSSLITGFNNHQLISEIKKKPERSKLDKTMFSSFENLQNIEKHQSPKKDAVTETRNFEDFDLSQNFEEFKLDDCEIEEYNIDVPEVSKDIQPAKIVNEKLKTPSKNGSSKSNSSTRVELIRATNDLLVSNLNPKSIELLKKQLEIKKNVVPSEQIVREKPVISNFEPTYEHFLECTGLSTKSILTPARMLSNHKSVLKPKDVKLRSKVKANNVFERHSCNTIKYWSEPYI